MSAIWITMKCWLNRGTSMRELWAKRVVVGAAAIVLAMAVGPRAGAEEAAATKPFRVVTTFTVIQDIAQNVAGTAAIVESITKPGAEIHDYQPTPLDLGTA